jgi:hypothetical protein
MTGVFLPCVVTFRRCNCVTAPQRSHYEFLMRQSPQGDLAPSAQEIWLQFNAGLWWRYEAPRQSACEETRERA